MAEFRPMLNLEIFPVFHFETLEQELGTTPFFLKAKVKI